MTRLETGSPLHLISAWATEQRLERWVNWLLTASPMR